MPTLLKSTKKRRSGWTDSSPHQEEVMQSAFSLSKSEDRTILTLWKRWEPIVSLYFLEGKHGKECSRLVCPCDGKHFSVKGVKQSHSVLVRSMLKAGIQKEVLTKHNLDSPMIPETDRTDWANEFILRQQHRQQQKRRQDNGKE